MAEEAGSGAPVATEKKSVKKKTVAKAPVAKAEKDNKMLVWGVAVAIVIAVIVLVAYFVMSSGQKTTGGGTTVTTEGTPIQMSQFADKLTDSLKALKQMTITGNVKVGIGGQQEMLSEDADISGGFDLENHKGKMTMTVSMLGRESTQEIYIIGNTTYMNGPDQTTGEIIWVKIQSLNNSGISTTDIAKFMDILNAVNGTLLGTETINGEQADKVKITPDIGKVINALLENQYGNDLATAGISREEIDSMISQLEDSIKTLNVTVWISKDSALVLKAEGTVLVSIDVGELLGASETGILVDLNADFSFSMDYKSPVTVTLPTEALNATDITEIYTQPTCGNGFCDIESENEINCPEDCGQLVGNDRDAHGCIPSAGYSWCEAKQKCIRVWEENCTA